VVPQYRPGPPPVRLEVHLEDLSGCRAAHHHMLEALVGRGREEVGVEQECDVDPPLVPRVCVDDMVAATGSWLLRRVARRLTTNSFSTSDSEQVGAGSPVHLGDRRNQLIDLSRCQLPRRFPPSFAVPTFVPAMGPWGRCSVREPLEETRDAEPSHRRYAVLCLPEDASPCRRSTRAWGISLCRSGTQGRCLRSRDLSTTSEASHHGAGPRTERAR
jgi:hypothetical protein